SPRRRDQDGAGGGPQRAGGPPCGRRVGGDGSAGRPRCCLCRDRRSPRRAPLSSAGLVTAAPTQVLLELAGDGVTTGLGQVGRVLRLLQRLDVLGDLVIGCGELVDTALPGTGLLREVPVVDDTAEELLQ